MREAIEANSDVVMDDVGEDQYYPLSRSIFLRIISRILGPLQELELEKAILQKLDIFKPDVLLIYKGSYINEKLIRETKARGVLTVNIFPDYSPFVYGKSLSQTMGEYDLVISTKPFHPALWSTSYKYSNTCVCIPHGYDPTVHCWDQPSGYQDFDVVLAASWRPEYHELMLEFAAIIGDSRIRVGIAGHGWLANKSRFPVHWKFFQPPHGRAYGEWLRRGKIAIAPIHSRVETGGISQPGDQDTTRTYELAAAYCFFLHRRTPFVQTVFDEELEVPMWDTAQELANLVNHFLPLEVQRHAMAAAAHRRAVPAYSIPARAQAVVTLIRGALSDQTGKPVGP